MTNAAASASAADTTLPDASPASAASAVIGASRLWRGWLATLCILYAAVQLFWITATPLQTITLPDSLPQRPGAAAMSLTVGLGPDEKEHFLYLLSLANRGQIPKPSPVFRTSPDDYVSYQAQHPPLFYVLGALLYNVFAGALGPAGIWYLLRAVCAAFGILVLVFASRAALLAFPDRPLVTYGTPALVAFMPMLGHMMGCLSNEPMAMALTAWAWWRTVRLLRSSAPVTARDGALLGLALGLAAETRLTSLMWLPAALLALFVAGRRRGKEGGASVLPALAAFCGIFALLVLPWLIHNQVAYGTPFFRTFDRPTIPPGMHFADFWTDNIPPRPDHPVSLNPRYTLLYFASTAWTPYWLIKYFLPYPPGWNGQILWQMVAVLVDAAAGILLVMHALHAREGKDTSSADPAGRAVLWAAGLTVFVCVAATFEQQLYADWTVVLSPGRYIIASVAASALLFAFALSTMGERRQRLSASGTAGGGAGAFIAPLVLAGLMLAFDIYSAALVHRFYALTPTQPAVQPIPKTTD